MTKEDFDVCLKQMPYETTKLVNNIGALDEQSQNLFKLMEKIATSNYDKSNYDEFNNDLVELYELLYTMTAQANAVTKNFDKMCASVAGMITYVRQEDGGII